MSGENTLMRRLHRYTYSDYVALELHSPTKHEFLDGEIYAISGGRVILESLGVDLVVGQVYRASDIT